MNKIISVMLSLTTVLSVVAMCFAGDFSQDKSNAIAAKSSRFCKVESGHFLSSETILEQGDVIDDLSISSATKSFESNRAGFFTGLAITLIVGYLVASLIIPCFISLLISPFLIAADVLNSKGK